VKGALAPIDSAISLVANDDQRIPGTKERAMRERELSRKGGAGERTGNPKRGDSHCTFTYDREATRWGNLLGPHLTPEKRGEEKNTGGS
jgi:hypothetical protein